MKRGSIMFCPKCGAQVPDGSPFCSACGAPMGQQAAAMNQGNVGMQQAYSAPVPTVKQTDFNSSSLIKDFAATFKSKNFKIPMFIAWGGAFLMLITLFLPFFSSKVSVYGFSVSTGVSKSLFGCGFVHWHFLIWVIIGSVFFVTAKRYIAVIIAGGIAIIQFFVELITFDKICAFGESTTESSLKAGVGVYFLIISALAIIGAGIWGLVDKKQQ